MSTPPYVPYQAYKVRFVSFPAHLTEFIAQKPKRHSQTFSRSSVSPGPSSPRPISFHDTPSVQPPQIQQQPPETNKSVVPNGLHVVTTPSGLAVSPLTSAPTPPPSTGLTTEVTAVPVKRTTSSSSQPPSVPATPLASTSSSVVVPDDRPMASSSTSSSPTSTRPRKISTFRHVPARAAQTPIVSSPLSLGKDSRITSLPSRTPLDPNKPHRPHSRLSTVTFPSDSPQAPPSQGVPVGRARAISQSQSEVCQPDRHTTSDAADGHSPTVLLPFPVQRTPSISPSLTPAASASPVASPSPPSTRTSTPVRSSAPYRPGFQPKGVYRPLTDDFLEVRQSRRDIGRVEQTRLERRLEKLINLHFGEDADKGIAARPKQAKRMSSIWELDIRSMGPGDLWRGVVQNQVTGGKADIRGLCLSNLERT